jgi:hypothetical protein
VGRQLKLWLLPLPIFLFLLLALFLPFHLFLSQRVPPLQPLFVLVHALIGQHLHVE